jgi:hypothetical protein
MKNRHPLLILLFAILMLQGCSWFNEQPKTEPDIYLEKINISLDADANNQSATAVDLLIVYDPALLKVLMKMDAKTYYQTTEQIKLDYPEMLDIWHWELAPGQVVRDYSIERRADYPAGAIIFANYYTPAPHRVRLGSASHIHVRLKKLDFCVLEQGCPGGPIAVQEAYQTALQENLKLSKAKAAASNLKATASEAKAAQAKATQGMQAAKKALKL